MAAQIASRFPTYVLGIITSERDENGGQRGLCAVKGRHGDIVNLLMNLMPRSR